MIYSLAVLNAVQTEGAGGNVSAYKQKLQPGYGSS
jgi:hypothetical protein